MGWLLHPLFLAKKYCLGTSHPLGFRSTSTLHIGETCVEMRPTHVKVFKLLLTSETFRFNFATSLLRPHFTSFRLLYLTWHQICENLRYSGSESLACSLFITWTILICRERVQCIIMYYNVLYMCAIMVKIIEEERTKPQKYLKDLVWKYFEMRSLAKYRENAVDDRSGSWTITWQLIEGEKDSFDQFGVKLDPALQTCWWWCWVT